MPIAARTESGLACDGAQDVASADRSSASRLRTMFLILYVFSGVAVLAMETVWIRVLAFMLGSTVESATLVIAMFFLFAAAGHLVASRVSARSVHPLLIYGIAEMAFAGSAFVLFLAHKALWSFTLAHAPQSLSGGRLVADAVFTSVVVGLPCFLAGTTFPLLSQAFVARADTRTSGAGLLYAGNLAGAAAGVLVGGIVLPFFLGYSIAVAAACGLSLLVGAIAVILSRRRLPAAPVGAAAPPASTLSRPSHPGFGYVVFAGSGALSIALEMLSLLYFQQFAIGSVYAVSAVIFAFLAGLGSGSFLAARLRSMGFSASRLLSFFLWTSALMCVAYIWIFTALLSSNWMAPHSDSLAAAFGLIVGKTALTLLPLLLCVGAVLPLAWEITGLDEVRQGRLIGRAGAVNKVGAALGAVAAPFVLVPLLGSLSAALGAVGVCYAGMACVSELLRPRRGGRVWSGPALGLAVAAAAALISAAVCAPRSFLRLPGERILGSYSGPGGVAAVMESGDGSRHIILNQRYILNGTGKSMLSQKQEAWIPLFLAANPKRVAFIGMASGISADAILDFPVRELDAIEVVPEVAKAAREHFGAWNARLFRDRRARVIVDDGRRVIQESREPYDLIICDLMHPAQEGTGSLYSLDFFRTAAGKLTERGLFVLWLPLYQVNDELAGIVVRTFSEAFPNAVAVRGNFDPVQNIVALVGSRERIVISDACLKDRLLSASVRALAAQSPFLRSEANSRLLLVGDLKSASATFAACPVNTDDRPVFVFKGPAQSPAGTLLRGTTFLNSFAAHFTAADYPSCSLGETSLEAVRAGVRAGNLYFAAATMTVSIPGDEDKLASRARRASAYLSAAKTVSPGSTIGAGDLAR